MMHMSYTAGTTLSPSTSSPDADFGLKPVELLSTWSSARDSQ